MPEGFPLLMDHAYEGGETRQLVLALGMVPVHLIERQLQDRRTTKK